ncbi:MAG: ATP-binding protein [Lentisphaeraceae bacterium]|nr:ATP-binding protein [Lentisphaeraceae bacterium]
MSQRFTYSLSIFQATILAFIAFGALILGAFVFTINAKLDKSMEVKSNEYAEIQSKQMQISISNFLETHKYILRGYSNLPILKQAAVQPESHLENAVDLMKSFTFIGKKHALILIDFEGNIVHIDDHDSNITKDLSIDLTKFIQYDSTFHIDHLQHEGQTYMVIGSEIILKKSIEGAILLVLPLQSILNQYITTEIDFELYMNGTLLTPKVNTGDRRFITKSTPVNSELSVKTFAYTSEILQANNEFSKSLILNIIIILIIFMISLLYVVNKNFILPVTNISKMTHALAHSTENIPTPGHSFIKELESLKVDFQNMSISLQQRSTALNQANESLESKVEERTKELKKKAKELEDLSKYKSEFLARMSHEIRTPMNAIIGYVEILQESDLSDEEHEHLEIIYNSSEALLTIINDILDFSKIEAGMMTVENVPFGISNIIKDIRSMFTKTADDKGIDLILSDNCFDDNWFKGDPHRIRQVLINLTGNALKFTQSGFVKINLELESNAVTIRIVDSGIGIPTDKVDDIFNSFSQAEGSITRNYGGTGLGLPISRNLAELMGGTLTAESSLGQGSTFCLSLKLEKTEAIVKDNVKSTITPWNISPNILLVEDNLVNQKLALKTLTRMNCKVTTALNGQEAIDTINTTPFDLILMDCQMPILDGLEATRRIRKDPKWAKLKIIAFTANATSEEIAECYECGMNDYISKPFKKEQFTEKLTKWLGHPT